MKKPNRTPRRQFLRGTGGLVVGLPFLPSLAATRAYGADPAAPDNRFFLALATRHGGVFDRNFYPADGQLNQTTPMHPSHPVRWGELSTNTSGGKSVLSSVLQAPSGLLTQRLVSKINVLRGIDVPWECAHNSGCHLGNYARVDGNDQEGNVMQGRPTPTLDQVMGYSSRFYSDLNGIKQRVMYTNGGLKSLSYTFSNIQARTGVQTTQQEPTPSALFDRVFDSSKPSSAPATQTRAPIVDRILANYRRLRDSNRRLSVDDKRRLDDHVSRLDELERRLNSATSVSGVKSPSCPEQTKPGNFGSTNPAYYKAMIDVMVTGFVCGTSRIGVLGVLANQFVPDNGNWHQGVAHRWDSNDAQDKLVRAKRAVFAEVFVPVAAALDSIDFGDGSTYLDHTLISWTDESGEATHASHSRPVVTAGSAAGSFETGRYLDYRHPRAQKHLYGSNRGRIGITHNQYMANQLLGMGVPRDEWAGLRNMGRTGYANDYVGRGYGAYGSHIMANANDWMPGFAKG